jgi:HEAT repeat-containing protein 5
MVPLESAILLLSQLSQIIKINNNSSILRAHAATFRLKLYQTLLALPSTHLYEAHFTLLLREIVAEFTLSSDTSINSSVVTSTLRSVCHSNDGILFANGSPLQDMDVKGIEDQLQPHSASGCEALEHDVTYLYQKISTNSSSTSISGVSNQYGEISAMNNLSSANTLNSCGTDGCSSALPLGVAVIDASIQLYSVMYPRVPNRHRLQILNHFIESIQKQPSTSKSQLPYKQALQINIFTAVLGSLKCLAETKSELGEEAIRNMTLKLVMDTLCHANPILRCAAGEALGRMTQVVAQSYFVIEVAQFCFEKLRNSREVVSQTGYALGLGCLHRYVGSMGAGQHMTSSVSVLFALAQNPSSPIVQVWAIHALYLIIDSGGSMFRNYIEPCVEFIVQSALSIPYTSRDVYIGLSRLLSSLITFMGPELQMNTANIEEMRCSCLTSCAVMQVHSDSQIRAESIKCLQELHLFAPKHVHLEKLVPILLESIVSKNFMLRKVSISCMRQLCQRDSIEIRQLAINYVKETKPTGGLLTLVEERGLEYLLFKLLDIESNPFLIKDIHDIINSLICNTFNEFSLKHWLFLCKDIAVNVDNSLQNNKTETTGRDNSNKGTNDEDNDDHDDDSQTLSGSSNQNSNKNNLSGANFGLGATNGVMGGGIDSNSLTIHQTQITKLISPKWPNRVFAIQLIGRIITMCNEATCQNQNSAAHFDLFLARKLKKKHQSLVLGEDTNEENYLILFLSDLIQIACIAATNNCDPLKLAGLDLLNDVILNFAHVEEPNPEFAGHLVLEQYQAQVSAALRPQFSIETSAHVTAKACQICSMWISSGVARELNDLKRVHQLLVSSLQKLTSSNNFVPTLKNNSQTSRSLPTTNSNESLIYSELSLTVEKLAVLRAWAEVYIVAQKKKNNKSETNLKTTTTTRKLKLDLDEKSNDAALLDVVKPELSLLNYHWSVALKDYAFLSLPSEYASQLPIEGGAFYHADLVESSKPIYKEHFTKILLAYSIWLSEINFKITNETTVEPTKETEEHKCKLLFMLLGIGLETLSNTTGLGQLNDETIEDILESINYLLTTQTAQQLLLTKSVHLRVEILSILYKVKLTRDLMSINLLVMNIVNKISGLEVVKREAKHVDNDSKLEKNATLLIYVILEICVRDLIKYIPDLLVSDNSIMNTMSMNNGDEPKRNNLSKNSFIYLNINSCKQLTKCDVDLLRELITVLEQLAFHSDLKIESKFKF